jgi:DNA-binding SARP family transcriptional activator
VEIDLLGRFGVRRDGETLDAAEFGGRRVRQLVRILAAERGRVVTRDALIEALWGDQPPADPGTNLNVVVNRARRALGEADLIETAGGGYLLRTGPGIVVDAESFETNVDRARVALERGDSAEAASAARGALELWDDPFPEDAYADWARAPRDRLERLHQEALEVAATATLSTGHAREAVGLAAEAVAHQPLREAAHLLLIRALVADGDQAAAVAAYVDLRRMLADELGLDPSPEASALYDQLLHGTLAAASPVRGQPRPQTDLPPLVGRQQEVDELASLGRDSMIAVVSGRSGWGKSRLLDDLRARSDRPVLLARALLPERDEPWSLARTLLQTAPATAVDVRRLLGVASLTALQDVLPDLSTVEPITGPAVDPQSRRALTQQGLVRVVEATAPSLVIVDDLQWADSTSLDVLALLVARSTDVVLVFAYRPEEVAEDTPVARFLAVVAETRPVEVALRPLDEDALQQLVASPSVASALGEHTDGSPFAVLQVARTLEREGLLRRSSAGGWDMVAEPAPDRVRELARAGQRDVVWRQFERQPREARELLASLALLGRPVPVRLLSTAWGVAPEDAMRVLRDLARNHLVRHDTEGFQVDHDLVGETIRDRLDPVVRVQLHQRLADALAASDGPVDELARHLTGAGDVAAAASAYATAAAARLDRFADREAQQLAAEGLALHPAADVSAALLEVRAETHARRGELGAARRDLRAAFAKTPSRPARSRLLTRLAELTAGAEDLLRAAELSDLALAEAGDDQHARARALYVRALVDMNFGDRGAGERFEEALRLFTEIGDTSGMADILDARAMTTFGFGNITDGIAEFDRVARLFTDNGNLLRVVTPRSTRGHGLLFAGRPEDGLHETSSALDLARSLGYAEGEAMVLWHHAEVLLGCGRAEDGLAAADAGVAVARRLGHRGWTAMTVCAQGLSRAALGDLPGAAAAFEESLRTSEHLIFFASWAHARLAQVLLTQGHLEAAASHVEEALAVAPGLTQYEARLARCELAVRQGDEHAIELLDEALRLAVEGGHVVSADRLRELTRHAGTATDLSP